MLGGFVHHIARQRQEEERFDKVFHSSPSMMSVNSWGDGRFMNVNANFHRFTGYEPSEVIGKTALDLGLVGPEELETFGQLVKNLGTFRNIEGSYRAKSGETRRARYSMDTFVLGHKKHLLVSALDITEDRQAWEEREEREGKFKSLFEVIDDGVFILDGEGRFTFVNERMTGGTRCAREWFVGRHYLDTVMPEDREDVRKKVEGLLAGGERAVVEFRHYSSSPEEMWLEVSMTSLREKGRAAGVLGTVRNTTGRKRADRESRKNRQHLRKVVTDQASELKRAEERYRDLVDSGLVGVFQTTQRGNLLFANEVLLRIFGFDSLEDAKSRGVLSVYKSQDDRDALIRALSRAGRTTGYEAEFVSAAGEPLTVLMSAIARDGVISGTVLDVTDRERMKALLVEWEKKYRGLIESFPFATVITRVRDNVILHANERAVRLLKAAANGGVGEFFFAYRDNPMSKEEFMRLVTEESLGQDRPAGLRDAYGGRLYVIMSSAPIELDGEAAVFTALRDVSEGKCEADRLAERELKYRTLFDNAGDAILLCKKYVITDCNKKALTLFKCSREQIMGKSLFALYAPHQPEGGDAPEKVFGKLRGVLAGEPQTFEWRCRRLYGTVFDAMVGVGLLRIDREEVIHVTVREVAERKEAQGKPRPGDEIYRGMFENSREGIFQSSTQGKYLTANPALARMMGYDSPEELIGSITDVAAQVYANPADRARLMQVLDEYDYVEGFEVELYNRRRERVWVSLNARVVRGRKGAPLYIEGTAGDITRRKLAEKALMDSERRYRNLVENSVFAISQTSLTGEIIYMNDAFLRLLGLDGPEEAQGKNIGGFCRNPEALNTLLARIRVMEVAKGVEIELMTGSGHTVSVAGTLTCHGDLVTLMAQETEAQKRVADELERKTHRLQEVGIALKVVLEEREKDRQAVEEKIVMNIRDLVLPYVETLLKAQLSDHHKVLVRTIEKNLYDLTSPLLKNMYQVYTKFTPAEVRVATLIRDGKTAKEIASILAVSESAVNLHRQHIRNKLGLKNEKENLRSKLLSLSY